MTRLRTLARPPQDDGDHRGLGVGQAGCALGVAHIRSPSLGLAGLPGGARQKPRSGSGRPHWERHTSEAPLRALLV